MKTIIIASVFSLIFFAGCKSDTEPFKEAAIVLRNNSEKRLFVQYYIAPEKNFKFRDSVINKYRAEKTVACMVLEPGESFKDDIYDNLDPYAYIEKMVIIDAANHALIRQIDEIKPDMFAYKEGVAYMGGDTDTHYKHYTLNLLPAE
jgi:hypothetical protein